MPLSQIIEPNLLCLMMENKLNFCFQVVKCSSAIKGVSFMLFFCIDGYSDPRPVDNAVEKQDSLS